MVEEAIRKLREGKVPGQDGGTLRRGALLLPGDALDVEEAAWLEHIRPMKQQKKKGNGAA